MLRLSSSLLSNSCRNHRYSNYVINRAIVVGAASSPTLVSESSSLLSSQRLSSPLFSTKAGNENISSSGGCPFTGASGTTSSSSSTKRDLSSSSMEIQAEGTEATTTTSVQLTELPSLPIVGSFVQIIPVVGTYLADYYKLPTMNKNNAYEYYVTMRERFGDFYSIDIPGMGKTYIINDPTEMKKVLAQEGAFPKGGIENLKPFVKWGKQRELSLLNARDTSSKDDENGFFGRGEAWRTIRTFLQTDLLAPQSARGYVPGIVTAAEYASRGANNYATSNDMNRYLNYCAFDMFNAIMFGELTRTAEKPTDDMGENDENAEFVQNSVNSLALLIQQLTDKNEIIKFSILGIETPVYRDFASAMDTVTRIATSKIQNFRQKWINNELDEFQQASYIARAFERQKQQVDGSNGISEDELTQLCVFLLNAGVDTTSTFIAWALVHLALNPNVQDKLYEEIKSNSSAISATNDDDVAGGNRLRLNAERLLSRKDSPYLHAVLRESHRLTPVHPQVVNKSSPNSDITIHGHVIPKGSSIAFESYSLGMDPSMLNGSDPTQFVPERWSPDEINKRKGTKGEVLDHQFFKDPFSQGARKCPGSRVAVNETLVLLSQLILDWKFEFDPKNNNQLQNYQDIPYEQQTLLVPQIPQMKLTPRN